MDTRTDCPPPVIAFLACAGFPPDLLAIAMSSGWQQGVSADAALLTLPDVDADDFYGRLAQALGVRFETGPVRFDSSARWPAAIHAGMAATIAEDGEIVWLLAPRAGSLEKLVEAYGRGDIRPDRMAITTPARFSAMLNAARTEPLHRQASLGLAAKIGDQFSAMSGASFGQRAAAAAGALFVAMAIVFGGTLWASLCALCSLILAGAILLRLYAAAASCKGDNRRPPPVLADRALPIYSVIVALYQEAAMVGRLVAALEALDYPKAKLDIKIVVEADDGETQAALGCLALPARYEIIVAPPGLPRTKPRALNAALPQIRGPLAVVFDAEDRPEPDQLRRAAEAFAVSSARVACLQARLAVNNGHKSWLAALFAIEYAALFDVFNPGLAALGLPLMLGGTSNHFRTIALCDVAGWDAWNVTEDADLGLRLARMGYEVGVLAATTHEEAPHRLGIWLRQRRRWFKGWTQTFITHSRAPRRLVVELGGRRALAAFFMLGGCLLGSLFGPLFAVLIGYDMAFGDLLTPRSPAEIAASTCWLSICVIGIGSVLGPITIGIHRRRLYAGVGWLCCLPLHYLLLSYAAWTALLEYVRRPFCWAKTEHSPGDQPQPQSLSRSDTHN